MRYVKEIRFRLTPEEKSALSAISEGKDMSQSAFVRALIQREARKHGLLDSKVTKLSKSGLRAVKAAR